MAVCAVVVAVRIAELLRGGPRGGFSFLLYPTAFVLLPLTIAWAAGPYKEWSLFGEFGRFQGLVPYLLVAVFGVLISDAFASRPEPIAWALVVAGTGVAGYALVQFAGLDPFDWYQQGERYEFTTSTLGNSNYVGGFLAVCLPVAFGLLLSGDRFRKALLLTFLVMLGGLVVTFSQGGWGAATGGLLLTLGFVLAPRWSPARVIGGLAAFCLGIATAGLVVLAVWNPGHELVNQTVMARAWHWRTAAGMANDSLLIGRGPNTFALEGSHYRPVDHAMEIPHFLTEDPHSVPFSFLTAAGVPGVLGLVLLLLWVVRRGQRIDPRDRLAAGFVGGAAAYFIQALVGKDELSVRVALWAILAALAVNEFAPAEVPRRSINERLFRPATVAIMLLAGGVIWWSASFVLADHSFAAATTEFKRGDLAEGEILLERALEHRDEIHYRHLAGSLYGEAALLNPDQKSVLEAKMKESFRYLEEIPDVPGLTEYGTLLFTLAESNSSREESLGILQRARRLDPVNAILRTYIADVLISLDQHQRAYDELQPLIFFFPRYSEYWGALALAEAGLGLEEEAQASIDLAFSLDRSDPRARRAQTLLREE